MLSRFSALLIYVIAGLVISAAATPMGPPPDYNEEPKSRPPGPYYPNSYPPHHTYPQVKPYSKPYDHKYGAYTLRDDKPYSKSYPEEKKYPEAKQYPEEKKAEEKKYPEAKQYEEKKPEEKKYPEEKQNPKPYAEDKKYPEKSSDDKDKGRMSEDGKGRKLDNYKDRMSDDNMGRKSDDKDRKELGKDYDNGHKAVDDEDHKDYDRGRKSDNDKDRESIYDNGNDGKSYNDEYRNPTSSETCGNVGEQHCCNSVNTVSYDLMVSCIKPLTPLFSSRKLTTRIFAPCLGLWV